ncbi:hypothetical protein BD779DRAFT_1443490, partial [Infundibulicybe gibba]
LVAGDYFKLTKANLLEYSEMAGDLIAWLRSKTQILGLMRDIQVAINATDEATNHQVLTVIRPVLTRWTSHYLAYKRILELRWVLETLPRNQRRLTTGNAQAQKKGNTMITIIKNPLFWYALARYGIKKHLEPLAHASCIMQATHARLDQVPLIFGSLIAEYRRIIIEDGDEDSLIDAIITSIEKRWQKSDQDIFVAAVILHPGHKTAPFSKIPYLTSASIWSLLSRLWERFFGGIVPSKMFTEMRNYLDGQGDYANLADWATHIEREATERVSSMPFSKEPTCHLKPLFVHTRGYPQIRSICGLE